MTIERDADVEDLLRRYQPVAPPAELRRRILAAASVRRAWPWAAVAAALLVAVAVVQSASTRMIDRIDVTDDAVVHAVDDLAVSLGGDAGARMLASAIVANQQADAALTQPVEDVSAPREGEMQ